jgi:hypothetical protein
VGGAACALAQGVTDAIVWCKRLLGTITSIVLFFVDDKIPLEAFQTKP